MKRSLTVLHVCLVLAVSVGLGVSTAFAYGSYGTSVDTFCSANGGTTPYASYAASGPDCGLCHVDPNGGGPLTATGSSYRSGGSSAVCPPPACQDNDRDGYGNPGNAICANGAAVDCNDNNAAINPAATEACDGIDNNCNGITDENCPTPCTDVDGDGYSPDRGSCGAFDCNDGNPDVYPGATEVCGDGIDNNCDGQVDEGCSQADPCANFTTTDTTCGVGACESTGVTVCDPATGNITDTCEPGTPTTEIQGNGIDENCNGMADDTVVVQPPPSTGSGDDEVEGERDGRRHRRYDSRRSDSRQYDYGREGRRYHDD